MATSSDIPWTELKALSFDIYGTLIDWQDGITDAALNTSLGLHLPTDRITLYEGLRKHDRVIEQESPHMLKPEVNAEAFKRYVSELGLAEDGKATQDQLDEAAQKYGNAIGSFGAFPDTIEAIQRLAKHYKLVPLSNIDHVSFNQTLRGPLKDCFFAACYIAEDIGSYKPDRKNFQYLLDHLRSDLGVTLDQLCHAAQSLHHDHATTKKMGIRSVWVDRYGVLGQSEVEEAGLREEYGFRLRVESLRQLADIVDRAFSG